MNSVLNSLKLFYFFGLIFFTTIFICNVIKLIILVRFFSYFFVIKLVYLKYHHVIYVCVFVLCSFWLIFSIFQITGSNGNRASVIENFLIPKILHTRTTTITKLQIFYLFKTISIKIV